MTDLDVLAAEWSRATGIPAIICRHYLGEKRSSVLLCANCGGHVTPTFDTSGRPIDADSPEGMKLWNSIGVRN